LEEDTDNNGGDDLGKEEHNPVKPGTGDTLSALREERRKNQGNTKGDHWQHNEKFAIAPKCIQETSIGQKILVVLEADIGHGRGRAGPTGERNVKGAHIGIEHKDKIEEERRSQEGNDYPVFIVIHVSPSCLDITNP
jgi:hypothetical protein